MRTFKADLHIHTVLSPCGSLEMGPRNIVKAAIEKGLDIIAITDHNSTRNAIAVKKHAEAQGLVVFTGVEICTSEDLHCLAYFDKTEELMSFQIFLEQHYHPMLNDPSRFGDQIVVDSEENIIAEVPEMLMAGLTAGIDEVATVVRKLNGVLVYSHIDRKRNSVISNLGYIPANTHYQGIELSRAATSWWFSAYANTETIICNSDAHRMQDIGTAYSFYRMKKPTVQELYKALTNSRGRSVILPEYLGLRNEIPTV